MLPSPDILSEFPEGKFVLSNLAAKRAKQLREGAPPLVVVESNHPLTIALAEIAAGKIKAIMPSADAVTIEAPDSALLIDETMPAELGLLLPALDETEASLIASDELHEDHADVEGVVDEESDELTLSGLASEEEEEEEVVADADSDTLSLSDIAEEESAEEDADSDES